jgi:IMP dehydrogenase/GMP reductase
MKPEILFDLDDIVIIPEVTSEIESREEIDIYYSDGDKKSLPLITAPMDTVVTHKNDHYFHNSDINLCYPREEYYDTDDGSFSVPLRFASMSLDQFIKHYVENKNYFPYHICIDTANGHMKKMLDAVKQAKQMHGDKLKIMVGNIANPSTYLALSLAGADLIRVGIGNGGACLTSQQTAINYPMVSLIMGCYQRKSDIRVLKGTPAMIVADGGMTKYSDVIKCLALGSDYVMVGGLFNKALESSGDTFLFKKFKINQYSKFAKWLHNNKFRLTKKYRGMSTKEVQKKWGNVKLKTSEGVIRFRPVEYTLDKWVENFKDYLKSNMSYSNAKNLNEYIGKAKVARITESAYKRFTK